MKFALSNIMTITSSWGNYVVWASFVQKDMFGMSLGSLWEDSLVASSRIGVLILRSILDYVDDLSCLTAFSWFGILHIPIRFSLIRLCFG